MILECSPENQRLSEMLGEFAEVCAAEGRKAITVGRRHGVSCFNAGAYCGFALLTDGTLIEVLPPAGKDTDFARKVLCAEFCKRCGYKFSESGLRPGMNFMEYFISIFAGETMKIIKSGVLSAYKSREENMTAVHGTILFPENIRRNLVHRERVYVRHDVFTPDRAENRIIKAASAMLMKLTADPHSTHLLKEAVSFLDEVPAPHDIRAEFSRCINTRNAKKYSTVLSICRMLFDRSEETAFSGRYVQCAQFYRMRRNAKN